MSDVALKEVGPLKEFDGTYICFRVAELGANTNSWFVNTKKGGDCLGRVKWWGRWRKYSFFPEDNCVFEEICLAGNIIFHFRPHRRAKRAALAPRPQQSYLEFLIPEEWDRAQKRSNLK